MARLRINQGLNLTLDASTTDFIVKSLSGPSGDLLLNGRNWSVEIRIDEDNSGGDNFRITKGSNGSTRLLTVDTNGYLIVGGWEVRLGTTDQSARGNTSNSRALVKDTNATLVINYAGDFTGGTRVDGLGLGIGGVNYVYNTNTSYQIPGADANAKWLIVRDTASGSGIISFNSTKDADGNILGSLVWTREGGQPDAHRQVAGIVAVQSGTGATAGSELRFYTKGSAWPIQRMVIDRGGRVGIGVASPTVALDVSGDAKVSGTITGTLNGNASTAFRLQTARSISLDGALSGSTSFDGSANVALNASINAGAVGTTHLANGAITGVKIADGAVGTNKVADGAITGLKLASGAVLDNLGFTPVNKAGDVMMGQLTVPSLALSTGSARISFGDKRTINVHVDHGGDQNTRYYYLGKVHSGAGILKVQGIMGGHTLFDGRANVDLQFSYRDEFRVDGEVIGRLGQADIWVYAPNGDPFIYLYLVTNTWALANLELSAVGTAAVEFNGTFSYSQPTFNGITILPFYKLSTDKMGVLRYTSQNAGSVLPVRYTTGTGITTIGSFRLGAHAFAMGPFALVAIYPTSWGVDTGFGGEGVITLYMSLNDLRSILALNSDIDLTIFSVQLSVHATAASIYNDNEYHYLGTYKDQSTLAWGIQIYRPRFTSADYRNLVQALILARLS